MHSASTTTTPTSLPTMDDETDHPPGISVEAWVGDPASATNLQYTPPSAEGEFDLIWPDTEDLFQSIMSSDPINPWQMPLGTLPFVTGFDQVNNLSCAQNSASYEPGLALDTTPSQNSSESHQAVQDVSQMVTTLVGVSISEKIVMVAADKH